MIEVFRRRHLDGKINRVTPASDQLEPRGRGLRRRSARAAVLLALVALDDEVPLDDVDLVGVFALALPLDEGLVAQLAAALALLERVLLDDGRQRRLLARTVASLRLLRLIR